LSPDHSIVVVVRSFREVPGDLDERSMTVTTDQATYQATDQATAQAGETAGVLAGSVSWFEVGTPDPEAAKAFYGELFGWSFAADEGTGGKYQIATTGAGHPIRGGIFDTEGQAPGYAVFCVVVADVAQACGRAEALGGSVLVGPVPTPTGLVFAHLREPDGNHFGIYSPPTGQPN
jgi:uncharacterized protein